MPLMLFNPLFLMMSLPGLALSLWAQWRVKSAYGRWARVANSNGLTGADAAERMLQASGVEGVKIEEVGGMLTDHYDPRQRVLRLSPEVYHGRSVASIGIAAHEAGHALQHALGYSPMWVRQALVPVCSIGSNLGIWVIMAGMMLHLSGLAWAGVIAFATLVAFQIITLPVEVNASNRAKAAILEHGLVRPGEEAEGVRQILNAAAWTYFAAMISSLMQLLYFVMLISGNRRDD